MLSAHDIHHGIILPAFLAVVLMLPGLIPKLRKRAHLILLVALTVAFVFPYMHLWGRPPFPPIVSTDWVFYLAIAVFPVALIIDLSGLQSLGLPVFFLPATLILWPILQHTNSFGESATIVSFIALASFLSYLSLTQLSPRIGGRSMHVILLLILAASSQVLLMSSSQTLGQTSLILAAALFGSLPLVWYLKIPLTPGPLLLVVLLWHGFLIGGHFAAGLTSLNALLLAMAPHFAWVAEARARQWPTLPRASLRFTAVLIPMLTAQFIAWRDHVEAMREFGM
jgi:hypothetical protein